MTDASVGTSHGSELRVRAVSDSAATALLLHNILPAASGFKRNDSQSFVPDLTLLATAEGSGAVTAETGAATVSGTAHPDCVREAIVAAAGGLYADRDAVILASSISVDAPGILRMGNLGLGKDVSGVSLHHHVWYSGGLSRVWGGCTRSKGTNGLTDSDGGVTSREANLLPSSVAHPRRVIFQLDGVKQGARLSPSQAAWAYLASHSAVPDSYRAALALKDLLEESGAEAVAVSATGEGADTGDLKSVLDGSAGSVSDASGIRKSLMASKSGVEAACNGDASIMGAV